MIKFLAENLRWIGAGFLLTFFSGFGQTFLVSLSNDALREQLGISHGTLGAIYSLGTLASALILLEFGKVVDRMRVRTVAAIVVVGLAVSCVLMAGVQSVWMLFLAILGVRLFGQGMMSHVAMTATGRWYNARRGRAISLVALGYPVSKSVLPVVVLFALPVIGLRMSWLINAGLLVLIGLPIILWLLSKERTPQSLASGGAAELEDTASWRRRDVMRQPLFYLIFLGVLCVPFVSTAFFFHQLHLLEITDWPKTYYAVGLTVFAGAQVSGSLIAGAGIDRWSARGLLPVYLLPMAAGLVVVYALSASWAVIPVMLLIGLTAGAGSSVMGALWPELFGTKYLGEIRALAFSVSVFATAASPFMTGYLIDQGVDFRMQLLMMGLYTFGASVFMLALQPRLRALALPR
ncbi:MAG: MFS transporter [Hyphomonadaceae bacterium]